MELPAGFENDWKKISSRRGKTIKIYVTEAE